MKVKRWLLGGVAVACAWGIHAEEVVVMEPVTVTPEERQVVSEEGRWSFGSVMTVPPFAELRQQGEGNPQADLSIRGGAFNMAGIAVAGLTLKNAQTEHWNVDLPLPMSWFESPTLLTGLERFRRVAGHPSGAVSLDVAPVSTIGNSVTMGGGAGGLAFAQGSVSHNETVGDGVVGGGGFLSFDRADQTDGIQGNDLTRVTGGGRIGFESEVVAIDGMAGYSWRTFGASGFYGTNPNIPAEETLKESIILGTASWKTENPIRVTAGWTRTEDFYEMPTIGYESEHVTDYIAFHAATRQHYADGWSVDFRTDADVEKIASTSLGDYQRSHVALAVLPNFDYERWTFSAGGGAEFFSSDKPFLAPAAGIERRLGDDISLFASYTETVRLPSYTEFNYNSPASLGNRGLKRQTARLAEMGGKITGEDWGLTTTLFYEDARNTVDWVKTSPATQWLAYNLARTRTMGATMDGTVDVLPTLRLTGTAMVLAKRVNEPDVYASRYVMDYPGQTYQLGMEWRIEQSVVVRLTQGFAVHRDNPVRTTSAQSFPARLQIEWTPPWASCLSVMGTVDNAWDDAFEIYPGQPVFGRRISGAISGRW